MKIAVIGTGYVGLVSGTCFAEMGHSVICIDVNPNKIDQLQKGLMPFYEPGLEEMVKRNASAKRLSFTTDYAPAVRGAHFCFIAVPTPSKEDGSADLTYIENASRQIAHFMDSGCIIANKSTAPIGTVSRIRHWMQEELDAANRAVEFDVIANPEFLKQGNAVQDCMKPDRIILGCDHSRTAQLAKELYAPFNLNHDRILLMDVHSAEMTKYAANAMLATRISFMNELAGLCERTGADINLVRQGIGADQRIGHQFLYAGIGFGGSCFPKDLRALQEIARQSSYPMPLIEAVETVNERQKRLLAQKVKHYFCSQEEDLQGKTLAIWGLSFKPDTDDLRDAPSLVLIEELLRAGAYLRLYDPVALDKAQQHLKMHQSHDRLIWCSSELESVENADGILLVTEWRQFRFLDFSAIRQQMRGKAFFDGRNQYKRHEMASKGFDYIAIGQPIAYSEPSA